MRVSRALAVAAVGVCLGLPSPAGAQGNTSDLLLYLQSRQVGTQHTSVRRTAQGWEITGSNAFGQPVDITAQQELVRYDDAWHPLELHVVGTVRGGSFAIHTTFKGTTASSDIVRLGQPLTKTDQVAPDTIVIPNLFFSTYEALAMRVAAMPNETGSFKGYVAPEAEVGIEAKRLDIQTIQTTSGTVEAHRFQVTFMNPSGPLSTELWTTAGGRLLRFEVPAQQLLLVRDDVASVSARRQSITRAGDESVTIPANGFNLAGTVSKPSGEPDKHGRFPAILLIPGSGPTDRDENVFGIPIFGELAGALADAGYLVLRYDKRGIGQSGGRTETAALADFAEDATAAFRYLKKRKDVRDDSIVLFGHSEGAWVALLVASKQDDVAAVVLAAAPSGTGAGLVLEQQSHLLDQMKLTPAEKQARIDLQKKIQAAVLGTGSWDNIPPNLRAQADSEWFRSFLAFSPAKVITDVKQPILIVQGERDTQVPPAHADKLADLARQRKKRAPDSVQVVKLPGDNHLLVPAETGEVSEYGTLAGRHVDPAVARAVIEFLEKFKKQ